VNAQKPYKNRLCSCLIRENPRYLVVFGLSLGLAGPAVAERTTYPDVFNDWVYTSPGSSVCAGYYLTPQLPNIPYDENLPLDVTADYSSLALKGNSMFNGNVLAERGNLRLTTEKFSFYRDPQTLQIETATAEGKVLIEEPQMRLYGEEAQLNMLQDSVSLEEAQFRIYPAHGRGTANSITNVRDEPLYLHGASYTTCAPDSNVWEVRAKSVVLDQDENRGVARDAWVYVKDIPVAYTPYISFPLSEERKSGFLSPNYANSNNAGFEFTLPYYLNLAPNYDATITPVWYSKRSYQTQFETRYLFEKMNGTFYAEWLPHDPEFAQFREDNLAAVGDFSDPQVKALKDASANRRAIYWDQNAQLSSQWLMDIDVEYVSDDNYVSDLNPNYFDLNNRALERQLQTNYYSRYWEFYGRVLDYQNLQPFDASIQEPSYNVLPQLFLQGEYPDDLLGMHYSLGTEASIFTHEDELFTTEPVTRGNRYVVLPEVDWRWQTPYAYFVPKMQLSYTDYDLTIQDDPLYTDLPTAPSRTLPMYNIDSGLFFDRDMNLFGSSFSQSLEPRLYYLNVPYRNQNDLPDFDSELMEFNYAQLFRMNRFTGTDRIGDANQLSYALTSRFTNNETGEERSHLSLGQIYYFEDRRVTVCDQDVFPDCIEDEDPFFQDNYSPFVSEYYYKVNQQWSGLLELQWNPYQVTSLEQRRVQVNYHDGPDRIFNLGYSFIYQGNPLSDEPMGSSKNNLDQVDGAFGWRVHPQWNLLAGIEYDLTNNFAVENFAGLEYENCCWALRFGGRSYLTVNSSDVDQQFDREYFIQWSFKGLANIGNSPTGLFSENLMGYEDTFGQRY
jgi:LPS-assembly protein